jgi:hypothetical protein
LGGEAGKGKANDNDLRREGEKGEMVDGVREKVFFKKKKQNEMKKKHTQKEKRNRI